MINHRKTACYRAGAFAGLATLVWIAAAPRVEGQVGAGPQYAPNGQLLAPVGYETWVFAGSNLGLAYKPDTPAMTPAEGARAGTPEFHNVYINPEAYARFRTAREFPDGTVLVMEKFAAAERDTKGVLAKGSFNGDRLGMEVAVKNSRRPDGRPTPWAYYDFPGTAPATAFPDTVCETCHKQHASMDNVWVQFYPTLRKLIN